MSASPRRLPLCFPLHTIILWGLIDGWRGGGPEFSFCHWWLDSLIHKEQIGLVTGQTTRLQHVKQGDTRHVTRGLKTWWSEICFWGPTYSKILLPKSGWLLPLTFFWRYTLSNVFMNNGIQWRQHCIYICLHLWNLEVGWNVNETDLSTNVRSRDLSVQDDVCRCVFQERKFLVLGKNIFHRASLSQRIEPCQTFKLFIRMKTYTTLQRYSWSCEDILILCLNISTEIYRQMYRNILTCQLTHTHDSGCRRRVFQMQHTPETPWQRFIIY